MPSQEPPAHVVRAARDCFAQFGVHRTRMEDVARRAGMSRSYLYRLVASKEDLVELALLERNREYAEEMRKLASRPTKDLVARFVEVAMYGIAGARSDREYAYLAEAIPRVRLQFLLTGLGSPIHRLAAYAFEPLLERARAEGRLPRGVSDDEIVHWLAIVISVLTPSEDIDLRALRRLLRKFALAGVVAP
jgi:AcrR family transcriptional regulator